MVAAFTKIYLETVPCKKLPTLFTVVSSETGLTHTLTSDWVTSQGAILALAFTEASLAPVTRLTSCEDQKMFQWQLCTKHCWYVDLILFLWHCNFFLNIKMFYYICSENFSSYMLHSHNLFCQEGRHSVQSVGHSWHQSGMNSAIHSLVHDIPRGTLCKQTFTL